MTHFSLKASAWESMTRLTCIVNIIVADVLPGTRASETMVSIPWASCQIRKIAGCASAGNAGAFPPTPLVSDPDMHHVTHVTHVLWCIPGSLTSGYLRRRWRGKRPRHSRRTRNPQFYVSRKNPILVWPGFIYTVINLMIQQAIVCIGNKNNPYKNNNQKKQWNKTNESYQSFISWLFVAQGV